MNLSFPNRMFSKLRIIAFAVASILLAGCSKPNSSEERSGKGVIAYSMLTSRNPFFQVIAENMEAEAERQGYEFISVSGDQDQNKQYDQVNDFISKKVAAIVLSPCNSKAIGTAIKEANEAGIPVFTCDIKSQAEEAEVVTHIATDNLEGGRQAGQAMLEVLGNRGGKVVILDYKSVESCQLRVQGFKDVIEAHNASAGQPKIEIVAELPGEGRKENGYAAAEDALQAHPDLAGIFAINDPSGLGAYAAIERAGKADQITIVAFDGAPEGKQAVKDGKFYASPVQFPSRMGVETVKAIARYFDGEKLEEEMLMPPYLYKKEDAEKDANITKWN